MYTLFLCLFSGYLLLSLECARARLFVRWASAKWQTDWVSERMNKETTTTTTKITEPRWKTINGPTLEINSDRTRLSADMAVQVHRTGYRCHSQHIIRSWNGWKCVSLCVWMHFFLLRFETSVSVSRILSVFLIRISARVLRRLCHNFQWQRLIILIRYIDKRQATALAL